MAAALQPAHPGSQHVNVIMQEESATGTTGITASLESRLCALASALNVSSRHASRLPERGSARAASARAGGDGWGGRRACGAE